MLLAEDQHVVEALAAERPHEPLRERVRLRRPDRRLDHPRAVAGGDAFERRGGLAVPVTDQEPELARSPRSMRRLRACWTVQAPAGWAVMPRTCTVLVWISMTKKTYTRRSSTVSFNPAISQAARVTAAQAAGLTLLVERYHHQWTPGCGLPVRPGRLEFCGRG